MRKLSGRNSEIAFSIAASLSVVVAAVFGLAWENSGEAPLEALGRPLAVLALFAVIGPLVCAFIYRPLLGLFPIGFYLLFTFNTINDLLPATSMSEEDSILILATALLVISIWLRSVEVAKVTRITFGLGGIMAAATFLVAAPQLFDFHSVDLGDDLFEPTVVAAANNGVSPEGLPDIIYIIPDRYASQATFLTEFNYDNGPFYAQLRARGFNVAANARANYPQTFQSLASALNSTYLEKFVEAYGPDDARQSSVYSHIEHNQAQRTLRALGYGFLNMGFWWGPTRVNSNADENHLRSPTFFGGLTQFERALAFKTPVGLVLQGINREKIAGSCDFIKSKFERLRSVGNGPRPTFVFAHFAVPHQPIRMNANGECLKKNVYYPDWSSWEEFRPAYVEYARFFNRAIIEVIDHQISARADSGRPLIIAIMSDEGPYPKSMHDNYATFSFLDLSADQMRMKLGILNAIYISGSEASHSPAIQTPINNWRIILNHISGAGLEMLPDASYVFRDFEHVYDFTDVSYLFDRQEAEDR